MTASITIVGLGSGDESQLTLGVWKKIQSRRIYLRTDQHPIVSWLLENNIAYQSFDYLYEDNCSFPEVYAAIADVLMETALNRNEEIIYAVPGHPMVAESTVQMLTKRCALEGVELQVFGGESFLDQAFLKFGFDPIEGFQLADATQIHPDSINPRLHTIIAQVYDNFTASDLKLQLMDIFPDDYQVAVGHSLGVKGDEQIATLPLYELDRISGFGNRSLVWVPRSDHDELRNRSFSRLHEITGILRSETGCPWDREQTHQSIRKNLIEETYEVLETIDDDDAEAMCEELGDILLQVMLHAQMEEEIGTFTVYDIIEGLNKKLIRRHPHVFGEKAADNAVEALLHWEAVKTEEKLAKGMEKLAKGQEKLAKGMELELTPESALSGVPRGLPGLMKAWKLQKKAARVGFDWKRIEDVIDKVQEELAELQEAISSKPIFEQQAELGDLLFAVVNLSRFINVDPETAISAANRKFIRRFEYIESQLRLTGQDYDETNLEEMEKWWNQAKKLEETSSNS